MDLTAHTRTTFKRDRYPCHPAEFEPTILACELPQTRLSRHAHWDRWTNHRSVYVSIYASRQEREMQKIL